MKDYTHYSIDITITTKADIRHILEGDKVVKYSANLCIEAHNTSYREFAEDHCVSISDNALKTKSAMYIDTAEGVKQCGYVITGKTDFNNDYKGWITQYIELWVNISEILDVEF